MSSHIDADLKEMTPAQLRREVMKWRHAARQEVCSVGNGRCWTRLITNLPEGEKLKPLTLPSAEFLKNCARYYKRNQKRCS